MFLLHLMRWLKRETDLEFDVFIPKEGPLQAEFAKTATVYTPTNFTPASRLRDTYGLIYANSAASAQFVEKWEYGTIPIVTHMHELDCAYNQYGARHMATIIRQSSAYIACAGIVSQRLQHRFRIPAERIAVHYEVIDSEIVTANVRQSDPAELRKTYDLPENALIIAACGTFDFRKAPDLFVQMAGRVVKKFGEGRPLRFLWIGSMNSPELLHYVELDVQKLGLQGQIKFIGELPSPHGLLALSDVFCLTSREDPFPLAMLEAASLGKPIVAFAGAGGTEEFCNLGGGVAVPYLDVEAMAGVCHELLSDTDRCKELGVRAAEIVQQRFTVEAGIPALSAYLHEFLDRPLPVPAYRQSRVFTDIYASWLQEEAPQRDYLRTHFDRQRLRQQVRILFHAGRKQEAMDSLVKVTTGVLAKKEPILIMETLVEFGEDLASLDPKNAEVFFAQAEKMSRTTGLPVDNFRAKLAAAKK